MAARWTRMFAYPYWLGRLNTTHSALFGRSCWLYFFDVCAVEVSLVFQQVKKP